MARIFVASWLRVSLIESANPAQLVARHFRISEPFSARPLVPGVPVGIGMMGSIITPHARRR